MQVNKFVPKRVPLEMQTVPLPPIHLVQHGTALLGWEALNLLSLVPFICLSPPIFLRGAKWVGDCGEVMGAMGWGSSGGHI